jgi:hypothetical protein
VVSPETRVKKFNKTLAFTIFTLLTVLCVYLFEYRKTGQGDSAKATLIGYPVEQISYFQIVKPNTKIGLQKGETGWTLLEPIHEPADSTAVEELLTALAAEKQVSVVKTAESPFPETVLSEFGLDKPAVIFNFKNNQGLARKISVGSIRNFEGNSYIQIDAENRVLLAGPVWSARAADELIAYRDKRVYRERLANVNRIRIQSLQDKFELRLKEGKWTSSQFSYDLDQNKVREVLRKVAETKIEEYIFEGEPSVALLKEKELDGTPVEVELATETASWSAKVNVNSKDSRLYLVTDRPTYLAKADPALWEILGNLTLDGLRDRVTAFNFGLDEVKKLYFKQGAQEVNLIHNSGSWLMGSTGSPYVEMDSAQIARILKKIRDLKISEFVDAETQAKFAGNNMLILKSDTEKLVLQLNWGPSIKISKGDAEKEYYLARTHLSEIIFALDKSLIENLELEPGRISKKSETPEVPPPTKPEK